MLPSPPRCTVVVGGDREPAIARTHNIVRLTATGGGGGRAADPAVTAAAAASSTAAFTVARYNDIYDSRTLSNASALDRAGAARILAQVAHDFFARTGFFVFRITRYYYYSIFALYHIIINIIPPEGRLVR